MDLYYSIVFFAFGLVFGSFYNVVGYRLPNKMSLIRPSSHCTNCNHKLSILELIPVISYIIQGGKCKNCKSKIAIFYPLFELVTGILFLLTYKVYGISIDTFIILIFISMILIVMVSDILYMIICDEVLVFSGISILILKVIKDGFSILIPTFINMIIPFLVLLLIKVIGDFLFKRESLGFGDIKLMLIFGMVLDPGISILTIFIASFIALPISLITLYKNKSHEIPLGPYLGIAAIICVLLKLDITTVYNFLKF